MAEKVASLLPPPPIQHFNYGPGYPYLPSNSRPAFQRGLAGSPTHSWPKTMSGWGGLTQLLAWPRQARRWKGRGDSLSAKQKRTEKDAPVAHTDPVLKSRTPYSFSGGMPRTYRDPEQPLRPHATYPYPKYAIDWFARVERMNHYSKC